MKLPFQASAVMQLGSTLALCAVLASCSTSSPGPTTAPSTTGGSGSGSSTSTAGSSSGGAASGPDLRFGVQTHFAQGWDLSWAARAAGKSIPGVRDELYWNSVEPTPGTFTFPASFDAYMAALKSDGLSPLVELDFANDHYDGGNTPYTDPGISAYARYCAQVVSHYGTQIQAVEIWNEYNGTFASGPATQDLPGTYTKMLKAAYSQIKAQRSDVTVAGGATAGVPLPFWEHLFQDGALSSMDVLSIHPYRYNLPPEGIEDQVVGLQNLVKQYNNGQEKPIWVTELGWQVQNGGDGALAIDEATQAKFLVRAYALLLSAGVQRIYWYSLVDDPNNTLGLFQPDTTPRQSASAMQAMIGELSNATFVRKESTAAGVYSMLFDRSDGSNVRVMWSLQPTSVTVSGVTRVLDLLGNALGASGQLNLTDSPVYVEGSVQGLPAAVIGTQLANSVQDFSGVQGQNGWRYGYAVGGGAFQAMPSYGLTSWLAQWTADFPFLTITSGDQHPSIGLGQQVAAVRRWVSTVSGTVHIAGRFACENQGGDGVGVSVLVDGQPALPRQLIGGTSPNSLQSFEFDATVHVGSTVDFAVDPGPGLDINFDATAVEATISGAP